VTAPVGTRPGLWSLGPLQRLIELPGVTDLLVNGGEMVPGGHRVWLDRGGGLEAVDVPLLGEDEVRALAVRLASAAGRRLDESMPWVDARLPGGVRLHAVVPPVTPHGTHLSLRLLGGGARLDLAALVAAGSLPPGWAAVLQALVRRRAAFLVTGGTGAGKTTLLAALLGLVPGHERIVLVEDVGELRPAHPHVVRLEARHANLEGRGEVSLQDLVRQALRMRPDRIVVGECRGAEVRELLAALNTGHAGGCGTLHANAGSEVPARLEALGSLAGLDPAAVHSQAVAAFHAVVHVARDANGRRVTEIGVMTGAPAGPGGPAGVPTRGAGASDWPTAPRLVVLPALIADRGDPRSAGRRGPGWSRLAELLELPDPGLPDSGPARPGLGPAEGGR
jgi:pilus assembly protein CpaF